MVAVLALGDEDTGRPWSQLIDGVAQTRTQGRTQACLAPCARDGIGTHGVKGGNKAGGGCLATRFLPRFRYVCRIVCLNYVRLDGRHLKICLCDYSSGKEDLVDDETFNNKYEAYIYITGGRFRGKFKIIILSI